MIAKKQEFNQFCITQGKGFRLTFANGWAVSVQFGPGNYTDCEGGRNGDYYGPEKAVKGAWRAESAEVAVFTPEGEFLDRIQPYDDVVGYVSSDKVALLLAIVAQFTQDSDNPRGAIREVLEAD